MGFTWKGSHFGSPCEEDGLCFVLFSVERRKTLIAFSEDASLQEACGASSFKLLSFCQHGIGSLVIWSGSSSSIYPVVRKVGFYGLLCHANKNPKLERTRSTRLLWTCISKECNQSLPPSNREYNKTDLSFMLFSEIFGGRGIIVCLGSLKQILGSPLLDFMFSSRLRFQGLSVWIQ